MSMGGKIKGANIVKGIEIEFEESINGGQQFFSYKRIVLCRSCKGQ